MQEIDSGRPLRPSRTACGKWLGVVAWACLPLFAQQEPVPTAPPPRSGFTIVEASLFSSYYSLGLPPYLIGSAAPSVDVGYDVTVGGAATFSLAKPGERTSLALQYTPSYTARMRYSEWNSFGHSLTANVGHSVSSRLRFGLAVAGSIRNREEFLFSPIQTSAIAAASGSLQDLSQALSGAGVATGSQMSLSAGASAGDTAAQSLFFGNRILTANARAGIDYSITPRLSLTFGVGGSRTQYFRDRDQEVISSAVLPQVTGVTGDIGLTYSLTPRTSIGFSGDSTRQQSRLQDLLITNGRVSVERSMGPHWFVNGSAGGGNYRVLRHTGLASEPLQYLLGAGLGYRSYSQTLLASFDHRVSDLYGVGATNTRSVSGSWRWAPPRLRTWLSAAVSRVELQSIAYPATTWRVTGEIGREIGHGFALVGGYSFLAYSNLVLMGDELLDQSAVRVALNWAPRPRTAAPAGN